MLRCVSSERLKDKFWQQLVHHAQTQLQSWSHVEHEHLKTLYITRAITPAIPSEIVSLYLNVSEQFYNYGQHN